MEIEGGTHNHAAPPYDFLARTFVPLVERMGPKVRLHLERYGFYPAGGGRFCAEIEPVVKLTPLHVEGRGVISSRRVIAIVANLPRHIAQRAVETAAGMLTWGPESHVIEATRESAFGQLGVSAEKVADSAARQAREYLVSKAVVCEHLTDQLLLPMAIAGEGSFSAVKMNLHARTNMEVIGRFLAARFDTTSEDGFTRVTVAS